MQAAGVETGSFEYFKYSLSNKEDLNWYYDKCQELGLGVGSYSEFVKKYALCNETSNNHFFYSGILYRLMCSNRHSDG